MSKKIKPYIHEFHVDNDWVYSKIGVHGGSFTYSTAKGLAKIGYIGSKNELQIFGYNIILYFKYLYRHFIYKK